MTIRNCVSSWDAALQGRPPALIYWLRESPSEMVATEVKDNSLDSRYRGPLRPAATLSGMVQISLDSQGRLVPPGSDSAREGEPAPLHFAPFDWNVLFRLAGLDQAQFQPATSTWNSLAASDARAAWTGTWPGTTYPLRVEAASYRGKPVYFALIGDWTEPHRMENSDQSFSKKVMNILLSVGALLLLLLAAVLIAWRNYVREKADVQGAWRLGIVIFHIQMLLWLFQAHFVAPYLVTWTLRAGRQRRSVHQPVTCALYLAIEPYRPAALAACHHLLEPAYWRGRSATRWSAEICSTAYSWE